MRGSCRCAEKLANTERHLDVSKSHALRAEDRTDELKQLNRSIFRPVITFNKDAKRAAQEAKIQQRYDDDRDEREKAMMDIRDTHNRLGRAATYGRRDDDDDGEAIGGQGSGRIRTGAEQAIRKEQRKRYQFDATASDDEMEDELDDNLNEISDMTKRLKALGSAMGEELDNQNIRIGRITEKTDGLDNKLFRNTQRVGSLLCSCAIVLTTLRSSTRSSRSSSSRTVFATTTWIFRHCIGCIYLYYRNSFSQILRRKGFKKDMSIAKADVNSRHILNLPKVYNTIVSGRSPCSSSL